MRVDEVRPADAHQADEIAQGEGIAPGAHRTDEMGSDGENARDFGEGSFERPFGAVGWTGSSLNLVSNLIPGLLITLGFAAAMHVVSEYYETLRRHPAGDATSHRARIAHVLNDSASSSSVRTSTRTNRQK